MKSDGVDKVKMKKFQRAREQGHEGEREKVEPILKFHDTDYTAQVLVCEYLHSWQNAV
jgi:hypothetical protein